MAAPEASMIDQHNKKLGATIMQEKHLMEPCEEHSDKTHDVWLK